MLFIMSVAEEVHNHGRRLIYHDRGPTYHNKGFFYPNLIFKLISYILVVGPSNPTHFGWNWLYSINTQKRLTFHEFSRQNAFHYLTTIQILFKQTINYTGLWTNTLFITIKPIGIFRFSFLFFPILLRFCLTTLFSQLHFFLIFLLAHSINPNI